MWYIRQRSQGHTSALSLGINTLAAHLSCLARCRLSRYGDDDIPATSLLRSETSKSQHRQRQQQQQSVGEDQSSEANAQAKQLLCQHEGVPTRCRPGVLTKYNVPENKQANFPRRRFCSLCALFAAVNR